MTQKQELQAVLASATTQQERWELLRSREMTREEREEILNAYFHNAETLGEFQRVLHATTEPKLAEKALSCISEKRLGPNV